ncbi:MAG TPA: mechanosensitive ion channel domain-containing protein [Terriglobales bacterium]|jgi:small-conductance mechanosensitive channel
MLRKVKIGWRSWRGTGLILLLATGGGAAYLLTGARVSSPFGAVQRAALGPVLTASLNRDEALYRTAAALAALADSDQEQAYAAQAARLSDENLDASFTIALQRMALEAPPAAESRTALAAQQSIAAARAAVQQDGLQAARLKAQRTPAAAAQLAVVEAQLGLDQDRLADAARDAQRTGSTAAAQLQQLQREQTELETVAQQQSASDRAAAAAAAQARDPRQAHGMAGELRALWLLHQKAAAIAAAGAAARAAGPQVLREHIRIEQVLANTSKAPDARALAGIQKQQRLQQQLARLDHQIETTSSLADTYAQWQQAAGAEQGEAWHNLARGLLALLVIAGLLALVLPLLRRVQAARELDRERRSTLGHLLGFAAELVAAIAALVLFFGRPTELVTVLGITGAGLTIAFEDTLLSFAGWFVLIGRNGVRLGDRVELNGVVGEVAEIRLLQTTLLELDRTDPSGPPTGRRVYLPNNFAVRHAYYNGDAQRRSARAAEE